MGRAILWSTVGIPITSTNTHYNPASAIAKDHRLVSDQLWQPPNATRPSTRIQDPSSFYFHPPCASTWRKFEFLEFLRNKTGQEPVKPFTTVVVPVFENQIRGSRDTHKIKYFYPRKLDCNVGPGNHYEEIGGFGD